jgi:hypothetical protein
VKLVTVQLIDIVRQVCGAATECDGRAQLGHGHTTLASNSSKQVYVVMLV